MADLVRVREAMQRCAEETLRPGSAGLQAGPLTGLVLFLTTVLTVRHPRQVFAIDVEAARQLRAPAWFWRCWAKTGWRTSWSKWSCAACSRWLVRRGMPGMRRLVGWRRLWRCRTWTTGRLMTGQEWAMRAGEPIPSWLPKGHPHERQESRNSVLPVAPDRR